MNLLVRSPTISALGMQVYSFWVVSQSNTFLNSLWLCTVLLYEKSQVLSLLIVVIAGVAARVTCPWMWKVAYRGRKSIFLCIL